MRRWPRLDQIGDRVEHGFGVVEHDRVDVEAVADAIDQHHRLARRPDQAAHDLVLTRRRDDQAVDHAVEQQFDLLVLLGAVLVGAAQHHGVAGVVEHLLDGRHDIGEEGVA